jgi:FkbM family methyltransferase
MYVSPECGLRFWRSIIGMRLQDDNLLRSARETVKAGNTVWDVGANLGLFSFAAAGLAGSGGHVYSFEPDTTLVALIRRSALLNPSSAPVEVIPCAASNAISLASFHIAERSRATNHLDGFGSTQTGGIRESQTVFAVSLDWMAERIPPPDVLKIDVEGAELNVFRGAVRLLESKRPTLIFESSERSRVEVTSLLRNLGYTLYDCDSPINDRRPLPQAVYNTLAIAS